MVSLPNDVVVTTRRLSRADYDVLVESGRFAGERLELIRGIIVEMSPQNARHAWSIQRLQKFFERRLGDRVDVRTQLPLALLDDSEPEPDIALVPQGDYRDKLPSTALLVVEVADSRLGFDRITKRALYAEARLPEYWIVNVPDARIEVHTKPAGDQYTNLVSYGRGERLRVGAFPDVELAVDDIL